MKGEQETNFYSRYSGNPAKPTSNSIRPLNSPKAQEDKKFSAQTWSKQYPLTKPEDKPSNRGYRRDAEEHQVSPTVGNNQTNDHNYFPSKRPQPTNNLDQPQSKSKGIGLTTMFDRAISKDKERQEVQLKNPTLSGSHSQGQLANKDLERIPIKINTPTASKKLPAEYGKRAELTEYQKLHEKLNTLENKIAAMKVNLERKKAEKESALDRQPKPRRPQEAQKEGSKEAEHSKKIERTNKTPKDKTNQSALKGIVTQVPKQNKDLHAFDHNPYSPRHNTYYVSQIVKVYKQQKSLARQHLLTSMQLLKIMETIKRNNYTQDSVKPLNLSKKQIYKDKKTVVFDLDETLIHCNQSTNVPFDVILPIKFPTGEIIEAGINIRPYAVEIIKALSVNFQVIVFTASHSCYANVVLDHLDPQNKYIQHRLFRQHCFLTPEGMYVKDIRVINRKLTDLVLVDNAAYSYGFQLQNGIPMIPYYEGSNDYELKALQVYLQRLIWAPDVRDVNKKTFKLHLYRNYDDPDRLVKELYSEPTL